MGDIVGKARQAGVKQTTPIGFHVTHSYPRDFKHAPELVDRILRAFVSTVVPGAPESPNVARAYPDEGLPFASYAEFFAADLCRRSSDMFGTDEFDQLTARERTAVLGVLSGQTCRYPV